MDHSLDRRITAVADRPGRGDSHVDLSIIRHLVWLTVRTLLAVKPAKAPAESRRNGGRVAVKLAKVPEWQSGGRGSGGAGDRRSPA